MKKLVCGLFVGIFVLFTNVWASNYNVISVDIGDGQKADASFFNSSSKKATIFVPGKIFDKSSWHFLAQKLQKENIASLCLDGKYPAYVTKSIEILKSKGFDTIYIVGGSMGAGAVLNAMKGIDSSVKKTVLLAPFGGSAIKNKSIKKLFVVAKDDFMGGDTYSIFKQSADEKTLKEYESSEHAQHLFKGKYKDDLTNLIVTFLK